MTARAKPEAPAPEAAPRAAPKWPYTVSDMRPGETVDLHGKQYPLVGGRLRLLREHRPGAVIWTEPAKDLAPEGGFAFRAYLLGAPPEGGFVLGGVPDGGKAMVTAGGAKILAVATGTSDPQSDRKLAGSLVLVAETRAIARCLRFAGYAIDATGAEEVEGKEPIRVDDDERRAPNGAPARPGGMVVPVAFSPREPLTPQQRKALEGRGFAENPAEPGTFLARLSPAQATKEKEALATFGNVRTGDQEAS